MKRLLSCIALLFASLSAFAQQDYVPRFDAFTGFSYLAAPGINLDERGFNGEFGVNATRWLALGFDYSVFSGHSSLQPNELATAQQLRLAPFLPLLPPGYVLSVPYNAGTYTFTFGPQFNYRHFKPVTLFIRPAAGGIHESVTAKPADPIQTVIVGALVPGGKKSDLEFFYGVGGGFDINASKHVGIRVAADYVHVDLFSGLLKDPRNAVRLSIGPTFRFGGNVR